MNPELSIIIVNYNTLALTDQCIRSIREHSRDLRYEIILVDNASTDGSQEYFRSIEDIHLVECSRNLGFGKANNLGFTYTHADYVLLLNSDTLVRENALRKMLDAALGEQNPKVGCWGCLLYNAEGKPTHSFGSFPSKARDLYLEAILLPLKQAFKLPCISKEGVAASEHTIVDYLTGADLLIKRSVIEQYGLFHEQFFMYYEDTELQRRYKRHLVLSRIVPGPKIIHREGESWDQTTKTLNKSTIGLESKLRYFRMWSSKTTFNVYKYLLLMIRVPFLLFSGYTFAEKRRYLSTILNS